MWPGLVAARIQQYDAWQWDRHCAGGAEGMAVTGPPPQPGPRGQVGAEPNQGSRASVGQGAWRHRGMVSCGAVLGQSRDSAGLTGLSRLGDSRSLWHAMAMLHFVPGEERAAATLWCGLGKGLWGCMSMA